jgi:hypothetical protein
MTALVASLAQLTESDPMSHQYAEDIGGAPNHTATIATKIKDNRPNVLLAHGIHGAQQLITCTSAEEMDLHIRNGIRQQMPRQAGKLDALADQLERQKLATALYSHVHRAADRTTNKQNNLIQSQANGAPPIDQLYDIVDLQLCSLSWRIGENLRDPARRFFDSQSHPDSSELSLKRVSLQAPLPRRDECRVLIPKRRK